MTAAHSQASSAPRSNGHQRPKPISAAALAVDMTRVRVGHWLFLLNLSASAFYVQIRKGLIPPPCGKDTRPYWRADVVRAYLEAKHQPAPAPAINCETHPEHLIACRT